MRIALILLLLALQSGGAVAEGPATITLPSGWVIEAPRKDTVVTGTMPQGMSLSPDGTALAVVESGYTAPALHIYRTPHLQSVATFRLEGAFGKPQWIDNRRIVVPGANADALFVVDVMSRNIARIPLPKGSYPIAVAKLPRAYVVACDGDGSLRIGALPLLSRSAPVKLGGRLGALAVTPDGRTVFASLRSASAIVAVDVRTHAVRRLSAGLHPSALSIVRGHLYVAETDADAIGIYDVGSLRRTGTIFVGDAMGKERRIGVSPNALATADDRIFVSLGAANSVAVVRNDRVASRYPAGRYPTDIAVTHDRLYVLNGKGEGSTANPSYRDFRISDSDYIGSIERGSLRAYFLSQSSSVGSPQGATGWSTAPGATVLRPNGPIRHVFFILKENRSYDQVLGDLRPGNGEASLAWFGGPVTPNQHALARRYGLFDNAYTNGEVSAAGHMWTDAAFANDYVERTWPAIYGGRRDDDLSSGDGPGLPSAGYLWEAARRSHVSFRDYGELIDEPKSGRVPGVASVPSLTGRFDPYYVGFDLDYSDLDRAKEWRREFSGFVASGTLPSLEFIWLPGDHTAGSRAGKLTPASYVAMNDYALGQIVEAISHSRIWKSSAVFAIEDDAQDGPDHVSDQRTTLYIASPYAAGGVLHAHYTTVSVLRSIEILLGIPPLSTYDAMSLPLYDAFASDAKQSPFQAIPMQIDVTQHNKGAATKQSAYLDFTRADAVPGRIMRDILARNHTYSRAASH